METRGKGDTGTQGSPVQVEKIRGYLPAIASRSGEAGGKAAPTSFAESSNHYCHSLLIPTTCLVLAIV